MSATTNVVTIHPYFKVHPGKMEEFKANLPKFIEKVSAETANLYYDFTISGDIVFCREGYIGAEGLLAHASGVASLIEQQLKISDLIRVEIHGPAAELEKLKGPLAGLKPVYYTYIAGVGR